MFWTLALDENVWILAAKLCDEHDARDDTAFLLLLTIERSGHRLAATYPLYIRWSAQIDGLKLQRQPQVPHISKILGHLIRSRTDWVNTHPLSPSECARIEAGHDSDDLEVVKSAAGAGNPSKAMVSSDGPLRDAVVSLGLGTKYSFQVLSIPIAQNTLG